MASGGDMLKTQKFEAPDDAPAYLHEAVSHIGTQEFVPTSGKSLKKSNPIVQVWVAEGMGAVRDSDRWNQLVKTNTMKQPWCGYFACAMVEQQGITSPRSGMARAWLRWGTEVDEDDWQVGDIGVKFRKTKEKPYDDGIIGHVFFLLWWDAKFLYGLGGNQGDAVTIQRFPRNELLGVRRARSVWASRTIRSGGGATANEMAVKPAVDAVLPNPQTLTDTVEGVRGPLETLAQYKPWIMGVLTAITVGLALYALYCRYSDHKSGRNA